MKSRARYGWPVRFLALILITSVVGCATAPSTAITLRPEDLKTLAGTWRGTLSGTGWNAPIEYTFYADGTYSSLMSVLSSRGVLRIVDGELRGERTDVSGNINVGGYSIWAATLSERNGRRVLTGLGRSSTGHYNFEITEQK